jgi:hypothetical protein
VSAAADVRVAIDPVPVPDRAAVRVPAPVTTLSDPERATIAVGVMLSEIVHEPLTANGETQFVLTNAKSVPDTDAALGTVRVKGPTPVLVNVEISVELAPMATLPKPTALSVPAGSSAVPLRPTLVLPPLPSCVMVRAPDSDPEAVGANLTPTWQVPLIAMLEQVLLVTPKCAPTATEDTANTRLPVLVSVSVCEALTCPCCVDGKLKLVGEGVPVPCSPVPERLLDMVPAPVLTDSVPVRVVLAVGVNDTVQVHELPGAKVVPQVVDCRAKSVPATLAEAVLMLKAAAPSLASVALRLDAEPTLTLPKARLGVITADCIGPLPLVAMALGPPPALVLICPRLLGTLLVTWACVRRPRIQLQVWASLQAVLSGW